jgi:hypothetical protein
VAVKGTFFIRPGGSLELAEHQAPPLSAPQYNGEPGLSSLLYDADLTGSKPTTDIIVNGDAYAPNGRPSADFLVSLRIGSKTKKVRVLGHRIWTGSTFGMKASNPEPVVSIPLVYERAFGGYDDADPDPRRHRLDGRNPVGVGVAADTMRRIGKPLHNFEYLHGKVDEMGPAGFGAIAPDWSPRRELAGTYDAKWLSDRMPLLPLDWDERSLLCSPADQRPEKLLSGGEEIELVNMTPDGSLWFKVPRVSLQFWTICKTRAGMVKHDHEGQLSMIIIEPNKLSVMVVWLTALSCPSHGDYLEETVVREKARP